MTGDEYLRDRENALQHYRQTRRLRGVVLLILLGLVLYLVALQAYANSGGGESGRISDVPQAEGREYLYVVWYDPDGRIVLTGGPLPYDESECQARNVGAAHDIALKDTTGALAGIRMECEWHTQEPPIMQEKK